MHKDIELTKLPPLKHFIQSDIFTNKPNQQTKLAEQFNINFNEILKVGLFIGLSHNEIMKNIEIIRNALVLKKITDKKLSSDVLNDLHQATCKFKQYQCEKILNINNIKLYESIFIEDIMVCVKDASNSIFKSVYLNSI